MKKLIAFLLAGVMVLGLCACGDQTEPADTTDAVSTGETTASNETTGSAADAKALAQSCIDKTVDELYALIGEPVSSDYAPSCLNPGEGEDGNLYYDGFVVYTYREGDTETVTYVE